MKILICDSDPTTAALVGDEHELQNVDSCEGIWDVLRNWTPDLILLELRLPEMGGDEACRRLKGDALTSHIPVVLISSFTKIQVFANRCGANAFLQKPCTRGELKALIFRYEEGG